MSDGTPIKLKTICEYDTAWKAVVDKMEPLKATRLRAEILHPILEATEPGKEPRHFCGYSHCTGDCGLPALTTPDGRKVFSSMVATGAVLQGFRGPWTGEKEVLSPELTKYLEGRMWR